MPKCPVCGRESFTVELRLIDKPPAKKDSKMNEEDRKFEDKLMCDFCYDEYKYR